MESDINQFLKIIAAGTIPGKRLLGKVLSLVENQDVSVQPLLKDIYPKTGRAYRIGITGPPGAGKSTLVSALGRSLAGSGKNVGIIAVDPSSSFSGGAVLGDRYRMNDIALDDRVFIRSMATRGSMGGLVKTAYQVADVMDAAGMDVILFETVGVGQSEIDIVRHADLVIVVLVPESGDGIQAMKAGLMEIADIFVINKSDRDQADHLKRELESYIQIQNDEEKRARKVLKTVAVDNKGVDELILATDEFKAAGEKSGSWLRRRKSRVQSLILNLIEAKFEKHWSDSDRVSKLEKAAESVFERQSTPDEAAEKLYKSM